MAPTEFTPLASLAGGALIGLAAAAMMLTSGRIAGVSGIAAPLLPPARDGRDRERLAFVAGLIAAPLLWALVAGKLPAATMVASVPLLVAAGLLVGFGSVWGSGCTSGHGVCGLSRLSVRSLVAVGTFMATGALTVFVTRMGG